MSTVYERFVDTNDAKGTFHLVQTQDCEQMMQAIKEAADYARYTANTQDSQKYIGSVPNLLAISWAKEWGVRVFSKEWLEKTRQRLKHDPNWRKLRMDQ